MSLRFCNCTCSSGQAFFLRNSLKRVVLCQRPSDSMKTHWWYEVRLASPSSDQKWYQENQRKTALARIPIQQLPAIPNFHIYSKSHQANASGACGDPLALPSMPLWLSAIVSNQKPRYQMRNHLARVVLSIRHVHGMELNGVIDLEVTQNANMTKPSHPNFICSFLKETPTQLSPCKDHPRSCAFFALLCWGMKRSVANHVVSSKSLKCFHIEDIRGAAPLER